MYHKCTQKVMVSVMLASLVFVSVFGALMAPRSAQAMPVEETGLGYWATKEVRLTVGQSIWASAIAGVVNSLTLFAQTVAYDLAVGLATGCRGENACAFRDSPGQYFTKVSYDAMGEFIGNLAGPWEELGINLCSPRIPSIGLAISLGLVEKFQKPTPKCDFLNTINNWRNVVREVRDPHALLKHISMSFEPGQSDFGQAYIAQEEFRIRLAKKQRAAEQERDEGQGIMPKSDLISGNIRTPSTVMAENFKSLANTGNETKQPPASMEVLKAVGGGEVWAAAGQTVLSTFLNTLVSRLLQTMLQGLFAPGGSDALPDLRSMIGSFSSGGILSQATGLSPIAVSLLTPQIQSSGGEYEYLAELASCPRNKNEATQFNCVIDSRFRDAIQKSLTDKAITVDEAAKKEFLHKGWPFGYINPSQGSQPEYDQGYSHSSMKKLRLLRVLPIGWEMAAEVIKNDGVPATLGDVLDGWAKTGEDGVCGTEDDESRFCGLVDPNWLLKASVAQCNAITFGPVIDSTGSGRQEMCADMKHCVSVDKQGTCLAWGYCAREKNIWKFDGDTCDDQYASCDGFIEAGSKSKGEYILENTVDFSICSAQNAGCSSYMTSKTRLSDGSLGWDNSSDRLYLDSDALQCDATMDGCSEFIEANKVELATGAEGAYYKGDTTPAYYRSSPDYLGCSGEQDDRGECNFDGKNQQGFAPICRKEEVGCELYTPKNGEPAIPGIISALDKCSKECVGYDTYIKQASAFEPRFSSESQYSLIPNNAKFCSVVEAGCSEFTNLQTEQREYFSSLRACQQPGDDSDTYFTWEGSDTSGYQLKPWNLKTSNLTLNSTNTGTCDIPSGETEGVCSNGLTKAICKSNSDCVSEKLTSASGTPPCTNYKVNVGAGGIDVSCTDTLAGQALCTKADTQVDADCRGFYDEDGNIYYRKLSRTILSTNECKSYRWTGFTPTLPLVSGASRTQLEAQACDYGHGSWDSRTNQCIYLGAPSKSKSCSAASSGCRGYKGNTSSNLNNLFTDRFSENTSGWTIIASTSDTTPPTTPASLSRASLPGNTTPSFLWGRSTDASGIHHYELKIDNGQYINTRTAFTYTTTTPLSPGSHTVIVRAVDNASNTSAEATLPFSITAPADTTPPDTTITASPAFLTTSTSAAFEFSATETSTFACALDARSWPAVPAEFIACANLTGLAIGGHTFQARATDSAGNIDPTPALYGWTIIGNSAAVNFSSESLVVGDHSAKSIGRGISRTLANITQPVSGSTYFVGFNVKGDANQAISVSIGDKSFGAVPINPEWQHVELGPLVLEQLGNQLDFVNAVTGNVTFFLDDVILRANQDTVYLIKNSWAFPLDQQGRNKCDLLPAELGGGYSPGAMLGCRAYDTRDNKEEYLKSFTKLCRERSVGCEELIQTYGNEAISSENFNETNNGVCRADPRVASNLGDTPGDCYVNVPGRQTPLKVCNVADDKSICEYGVGKGQCASGARGCSYILLTDIVGDNVTVPGDQHRYIVAEPQFACSKEYKGCQALGKDGASESPTYLRNDPAKYGTDLCQFEALDCGSWTRTSDRSSTYFKVPKNESCAWNNNLDVGENSYSGWFLNEKQPVGNQNPVNSKEKCSGYGSWKGATKTCVDKKDGHSIDLSAPPPESPIVAGCGRLGETDECGTGTNKPCSICAKVCNSGAGGVWEDGACKENTPCSGVVKAETSNGRPILKVDVDETYLIGGTTFGIWHNADSLYKGRVGTCAEDQATCTAFVDPIDKSSESPQGTVYHLKDNAKLDLGRAECNGKISRASGCALFKDLDNPIQTWSAQDSYDASDLENGGSVPPVAITGSNDANTIIKVVRDRQCSEWFQCTSAQLQRANGKIKTICMGVGRCNKSSANPEESGSINNCGSWIPRPLLNDYPQISQEVCESYSGLSWNSEEKRCNFASIVCSKFGGIWLDSEKCQLGRINRGAYLLRDKTYVGQEYTGYSIPGVYGADLLKEVNIQGDDFPYLGRIIPDTSCISHSNCASDQKCTTDRQCAESPTGGSFGNTEYDSRICRGFPERTSPLPNNTNTSSTEFENMPKCFNTPTGNNINSAELAGNACECSYKKITYNSQTHYYKSTEEDIPSGVCIGCSVATAADCDTKLECETNNGNWEVQTDQGSALGWYGYCLDYDISRNINRNNNRYPCLAWYPVDQLPSAVDIDNQHKEAAYTPGGNIAGISTEYGRYYCLNAGAARATLLLDVGDGAATVVAPDDQMVVKTDNSVVSHDIYKYNIKQIRIAIGSTPSNVPSSNGPRSKTYTFYSGDTTEGLDVEEGTDRVTRRLEGIGGVVIGDSDVTRTTVQAYDFELPGSDNDRWWWWGGDDNYDETDFANRPPTRPSGFSKNTISNDIMKETQGRFLDTSEGGSGEDVWDHGLDIDEWQFRCEDIIGGRAGEDWDENYDGAFVGLHFGTDQKLDALRWGFCSVNGEDGATISVRIVEHPYCSVVAKIDTEIGAANSAPNTEALSTLGDLAFSDARSHSYTRATRAEPFGSSLSNRDPDDDWSNPWYLNHNKMEGEDTVKDEITRQVVDLAPFAGYPYSCASVQTSGDAVSDQGCTVGFSVGGNVSEYEIHRGEWAIVNDTRDTLIEARADFARIFAKSDEAFEWNNSLKKYVAIDRDSPNRDALWDIRAGSTYHAPRFLAAYNDGTTGSGPLAVNNQSGGGSQVIGRDGFMLATAKFYVWADDHMMPIRRMKIDWGDGEVNTTTGIYQNAMSPDNVEYKCDGSSFGRSSNACRETPYEFAHLYSCSGNSDPNWKSGLDCPVFDFTELYGGCCVFEPKIQAKDNWGFCNGNCSGAKCVDSGCDGSQAWSAFEGKVIVAP